MAVWISYAIVFKDTGSPLEDDDEREYTVKNIADQSLRLLFSNVGTSAEI